MRVFDLVYCCRLFAEVAPTDASWVELNERTGGRIDLRDGGHRLATVEWLRKWGCRSLATEDTDLTLAAMAAWADDWSDRLPGDTTLDALTDQEIEVAADAYGELATVHAAHRRVKGKAIPVTFGATAAAKALYALRPGGVPAVGQRHPRGPRVRREPRLLPRRAAQGAPRARRGRARRRLHGGGAPGVRRDGPTPRRRS